MLLFTYLPKVCINTENQVASGIASAAGDHMEV